MLFAGEAVPHFNEVDECAGLDGLVTYRLWRELGFAPENTLHDLRWGQHYRGNGVNDYVWVFLISGAVPPAHLIGGYRGATSERQPPMYFRLGGGTHQGRLQTRRTSSGAACSSWTASCTATSACPKS